MKLERSTPEDAEECISWMRTNLTLNDCSPRTLKGAIFYKIPGVLYLPVKPVLLLESLAPNPAVTGKKRLLALRRAMEDLQKIYPGAEIQFLTRNNVPLAEAAKYYGFEEAKGYVLLRLLNAREARKRAQESAKGLAQARLRQDAGANRADETAATGHVSGLRHAVRERQSQEPASHRPYRGHDHREGNHPQPLQLADRPRA